MRYHPETNSWKPTGGRTTICSAENCGKVSGAVCADNNHPNCNNDSTACQDNLTHHYKIKEGNNLVLKVGNISHVSGTYTGRIHSFTLYGGNSNNPDKQYNSVNVPPTKPGIINNIPVNRIDIEAYIEALSDPDYVDKNKPDKYKKYGGNGIEIKKINNVNVKPCSLYPIDKTSNYIKNTHKKVASNRYAGPLGGMKSWAIFDNYIKFQYGYIKANESVLFGYNGYGILLKDYKGWNHEDNENLTNDISLLNSFAFNTKKNKKHVTIPTIFVLTIIALFMAICVSFVLYNRGKISKQKLVFYIILFISISILNLYIFNSFPSEVEEKNKNLGVWEELLNTNVEDTQRHIPNASIDFNTNNMENDTDPTDGNKQIGSGWAYSNYNFFDPIISSINGYKYTTYQLPDSTDPNQTHKNTDYLSYIIGNQSKDSQYSNPSIIEYLDSITDSSNQVSNLNGLVPSIIDKITITGGQTTQNTYIVNNFRDRTLVYGLTHMLFQQMYNNLGGWSDTTKNKFMTNNILTYNQSSLPDYITNFLDTNLLNEKDKKYNILDKGSNFIKSITFPTPTYDKKKFTTTLEIKLPYEFWNDFHKSLDYNKYINKIMSNILFDTEVTQVYHGNVEIPVLPSQYEYIENEDQVYTIQLQKKNETSATYKITSKIVGTNTGTGTDDGFNCFYSIKCKVTRYSPLLYVYLYYHSDKSSLKTVKNQILNDLWRSNLQLYPSYFLDDSDKSIIQKGCATRVRIKPLYEKQLITFDSIIELFIVYKNGNCNCYNSKIAPGLDMISGNKASLCFNLQCRKSDKSTFLCDEKDDNCDINSICSNYCDEVQDWFNSPNPYERAYNPDDIDEAFYEEVCNRKLRNKSNDINTKILIHGSIVTIIITTVTFIVLHNNNSNYKYLLSMIMLIMLSGSIIFLSFDLNGYQICDGKPASHNISVCKSKISHVTIPQEYCGESPFPCECKIDTPSTQCTCQSQILIPNLKKGENSYEKRGIELTNINKIQLEITILLCTLFICLPILFHNLNVSNSKLFEINNTIYWVIMCLLIIIPVLIFGFYGFKKEPGISFLKGDCCSEDSKISC